MAPLPSLVLVRRRPVARGRLRNSAFSNTEATEARLRVALTTSVTLLLASVLPQTGAVPVQINLGGDSKNPGVLDDDRNINTTHMPLAAKDDPLPLADSNFVGLSLPSSDLDEERSTTPMPLVPPSAAAIVQIVRTDPEDWTWSSYSNFRLRAPPGNTNTQGIGYSYVSVSTAEPTLVTDANGDIVRDDFVNWCQGECERFEDNNCAAVQFHEPPTTRSMCWLIKAGRDKEHPDTVTANMVTAANWTVYSSAALPFPAAHVPFSPPRPPAYATCIEAANGAVDRLAEGCDYYATQSYYVRYEAASPLCEGRFDDDDFSVATMCCACGGGSTSSMANPTASSTGVHRFPTTPTPLTPAPASSEAPTQSPTLPANHQGAKSEPGHGPHLAVVVGVTTAVVLVAVVAVVAGRYSRRRTAAPTNVHHSGSNSRDRNDTLEQVELSDLQRDAPAAVRVTAGSAIAGKSRNGEAAKGTPALSGGGQGKSQQPKRYELISDAEWHRCTRVGVKSAFKRLQMTSAVAEKQSEEVLARIFAGSKAPSEHNCGDRACFLVSRASGSKSLSNTKSKFQVQVAGIRLIVQKAIYASYHDVAAADISWAQVQQACLYPDENWWCLEPTHLVRSKKKHASPRVIKHPLPSPAHAILLLRQGDRGEPASKSRQSADACMESASTPVAVKVLPMITEVGLELEHDLTAESPMATLGWVAPQSQSRRTSAPPSHARYTDQHADQHAGHAVDWDSSPRRMTSPGFESPAPPPGFQTTFDSAPLAVTPSEMTTEVRAEHDWEQLQQHARQVQREQQLQLQIQIQIQMQQRQQQQHQVHQTMQQQQMAAVNQGSVVPATIMDIIGLGNSSDDAFGVKPVGDFTQPSSYPQAEAFAPAQQYQLVQPTQFQQVAPNTMATMYTDSPRTGYTVHRLPQQHQARHPHLRQNQMVSMRMQNERRGVGEVTSSAANPAGVHRQCQLTAMQPAGMVGVDSSGSQYGCHGAEGIVPASNVLSMAGSSAAARAHPLAPVAFQGNAAAYPSSSQLILDQEQLWNLVSNDSVTFPNSILPGDATAPSYSDLTHASASNPGSDASSSNFEDDFNVDSMFDSLSSMSSTAF